jgi:thiamine-monophosphate kinase
MPETAWIQRYITPLVHAPGADQLRDDVARMSTDGVVIATMDTLVERVHFLPEDPRDTVGQKLVRVNVSDILSKGAEPVEALLSIAWPKHASETEFASLLAGIRRDIEDYSISLIGGDLVGTDGPLTLTMTLTGRCILSAPVRRSGGTPGQTLYISGEIGWGGLGLAAARHQGDPQTAARYRVPRIGSLFTAQIVADLAAASMDVSDGLLIDVSRMAAASDCGAEIDLDKVPLAAPSGELGDILAQCTSGDDYRVLISAEAGTDIPGFTAIGRLTEASGLRLSYRGSGVNPPSMLGFEH